MGLSAYINKDYMNVILSDALAKYDPDNNGYTRQEFSNALEDVTSVFARCIIKLSKYDKSLFNEINTDKNNVMSYEEISDYIKKEFSLNLSELYPLTLKEICYLFDKMDKNKNE